MNDHSRGVEAASAIYQEAINEYVQENDKLRELVRYMHRCYVRGHDWGPYGAPEKEWVEEQMRELGIEAQWSS